MLAAIVPSPLAATTITKLAAATGDAISKNKTPSGSPRTPNNRAMITANTGDTNSRHAQASQVKLPSDRSPDMRIEPPMQSSINGIK